MTSEANPGGRLSLADVARRNMVIVGVFGGSLLLAVLVYDLRTILVWVLIALLLAVAIAPAVARLEKRRVPRWLGAMLVTLAAAVLGALIVAVTVPLISQSRELLGNLPHLAEVIAGEAPEAGPVPLSKDEEQVAGESAEESRREGGQPSRRAA